MTTPLVTVGIPCYNAASTIVPAIRSVLAQAGPALELIVVDDGSSDGSRAAIESVADPRLRLIADGTNRRLPTRLNQIAAEARGEFLMRMDADDLCLPGRLERQVAHLQAHADIDLLGGWCWLIDTDWRVRGQRRTPAAHAEIVGSGMPPLPIIHPTVMGRTAWFRAHPYRVEEPPHRVEDNELWLRAMADSRFANLQEPLIYYREPTHVRLGAYRRSKIGIAELLRLRGRHGAAARKYAEAWVGTAIMATGNLLGVNIVDRLRGTPAPPADELAAAQAELDRWRAELEGGE